MFPTDDTTTANETTITAVDTTIYNTLKFDFEDRQFKISDGRCIKINDVAAIKQWIRKFLYTPLGDVPIYAGIKFGTTIKKIKGYKNLNNGFIESELEREIKEGLVLNPAINQVTYVEISKSGKFLNLEIGVELSDGTNLEERFNVDIS